jgi:hypothetical protein
MYKPIHLYLAEQSLAFARVREQIGNLKHSNQRAHHFYELAMLRSVYTNNEIVSRGMKRHQLENFLSISFLCVNTP